MEIKFEKSGDRKRYFVNGTEYSKLEDVPAEFRTWFKDENNDGVPDSMEIGNLTDRFFKDTKKMLAGDSVQSYDGQPGAGWQSPDDAGATPKKYLLLKIMAAIMVAALLAILYGTFGPK